MYYVVTSKNDSPHKFHIACPTLGKWSRWNTDFTPSDKITLDKESLRGVRSEDLFLKTKGQHSQLALPLDSLPTTWAEAQVIFNKRKELYPEYYL